MSSLDALIFDFDGVILETESPAYLSWCELYQSKGVELPLSVWQDEVGSLGRFDPFSYLEGLTGAELSDGEREARWQRKLELIGMEKPMPGVEALLDEAAAQGVPVGVASSDTDAWVNGHLQRLGLADRIQVVITANGEAARAKPAPTVFVEALGALGVTAARSVAFEDSANGVAAAKAASLPCIAVPNDVTRSTDLTAADWIVATLEGVTLADVAALTTQ